MCIGMALGIDFFFVYIILPQSFGINNLFIRGIVFLLVGVILFGIVNVLFEMIAYDGSLAICHFPYSFIFPLGQHPDNIFYTLFSSAATRFPVFWTGNHDP